MTKRQRGATVAFCCSIPPPPPPHPFRGARGSFPEVGVKHATRTSAHGYETRRSSRGSHLILIYFLERNKTFFSSSRALATNDAKGRKAFISLRVSLLYLVRTFAKSLFRTCSSK